MAVRLDLNPAIGPRLAAFIGVSERDRQLLLDALDSALCAAYEGKISASKARIAGWKRLQGEIW